MFNISIYCRRALNTIPPRAGIVVAAVAPVPDSSARGFRFNDVAERLV